VTGTGGNGGSGVVILKHPIGVISTFGAGLTYSQATVGAYQITTFTAGTDTITVA
jgi:hypothetical protein